MKIAAFIALFFVSLMHSFGTSVGGETGENLKNIAFALFVCLVVFHIGGVF